MLKQKNIITKQSDYRFSGGDHSVLKHYSRRGPENLPELFLVVTRTLVATNNQRLHFHTLFRELSLAKHTTLWTSSFEHEDNKPHFCLYLSIYWEKPHNTTCVLVGLTQT